MSSKYAFVILIRSLFILLPPKILCHILPHLFNIMDLLAILTFFLLFNVDNLAILYYFLLFFLIHCSVAVFYQISSNTF